MKTILGYGTWGLSNQSYGRLKEDPSYLLKYAIKNNINFFDTAPLYGNGNVEKLIGSLDKKTRHKIKISTKCGMLPHIGFNMKQDFSEKKIIHDLYLSLKRMNRDYIDYWLLHSPNLEKINVDNIFKVMNEVKKLKIVKNFGVSLRSPFDFFKIEHLKFDCIEFNFNLLDQRALSINLIDKCKKKNITTICRTPLVFGFLSHKDISKKKFSKLDHRKHYPKKQLKIWENSKNLFMQESFYEKFGNFTQFALNFCFSNSFDYVIPGMLTKKEIDENIKVSRMQKINRKNIRKIHKIYLKNEVHFWKTKKPKKV